MHSDSHFQIGYSHHICEDYALSGISEDGSFHYAIVSDGCSDSKKHNSNAKTDIGARVLAHCAVDVLNSVLPESNMELFDLRRLIGELTIKNAQKVIRSLGLPDSSLDATLLITVAAEDNTMLTFFYGDGSIHMTSEGQTVSYDVSYPSGAPYYLSYLLDVDRNNMYFEKFGDVLIVEGTGLSKNLNVVDSSIDMSIKNDSPAYEEENVELVTIMSDGIETFEYLKVSDESLPTEIAEMAVFKSTGGEYVKRKMIWLASKNAKKGIVHTDDFSMASICL